MAITHAKQPAISVTELALLRAIQTYDIGLRKMTIQAKDRLWLEDKWLSLLSSPMTICTKPELPARLREIATTTKLRSTAHHRGYTAQWRVQDQMLMLDDLFVFGLASPSGSDLNKPFLGVNWLFPDATGPVAATWLTGKILAAEGEPYTYYYSQFWPWHVEISLLEGRVVEVQRHDKRAEIEQAKADAAESAKALDQFGLEDYSPLERASEPDEQTKEAIQSLVKQLSSSRKKNS